MKIFPISPIPLIFGAILGFIIGQLILNEINRTPKIIKYYSINFDTIYTSGGHTMYWKQDTLWKDENHTIFLKVYSEKLLR